ncbi:MAG: protease complex subunit PrcB family protein [Elusimicrobia bacterium]|nr:protease complex subunit PrcB family protein [Elusimicrobiota bacterium]
MTILSEWQGQMSAITESGAMVIKDTESWQAFWVQTGQGNAPAVDFERYMVVAAFLGSKPTGGYAVSIEKIEKKKRKIMISVKTTKPTNNSFVIQAFTSPYHIKIIERSAWPVEFKYINEK